MRLHIIRRPYLARITPSAFIQIPPIAVATSRRHRSTGASPQLPSYDNILVTHPREGVSLVTLNHPKTLNALSTPLFRDLNSALSLLDSSAHTRCIVLTGSEKSFAAGADIKEMSSLGFSDVFGGDFIKAWSSQVQETSVPIIAAVNGYALGGGCELAMMCDIIYAGPTAKFGQPEIKLGVIPGAGGSQRLIRAIGKSRAMDLILTGKMITAQQAGEWGLVARVFESADACVDGALDTAETIAGYGKLAVKAAKEVVNVAEEVGLSAGVRYERRVFHGLFGSKDQKVGMEAFANKTRPDWTDE